MWSNLLPGLRDRGAEVELVTLNGAGETFEQLTTKGIPTTFLDAGAGLAASRSIVRFTSIARRFAPTALVSFEPSCHGIAAVTSRLLAVPHLLNWHQQVGLGYTGHSRRACIVAARLGSGVIAGSKANYPDLMELGFPRGRLAEGRTGVPDPTSGEGLAGQAPGVGFNICLAARMEHVKRIDVFLEAMALLGKEVPEVRGTVLGDGSLRRELEQLRDALGAPVTFTGVVPEPMMVMRSSDVVCLTSDFETTPLALMEAAACGRPAVATDTGAVSEIVIDGATGLTCPTGDARAVANALARLARDRKLRARMGAAARTHWLGNHSVEAMVASYWDLLEGVEGPPVAWAGSN